MLSTNSTPDDADRLLVEMTNYRKHKDGRTDGGMDGGMDGLMDGWFKQQATDW